MADAQSFHDNQPNLWLGTPRTAAHSTPLTAGLILGQSQSEDNLTPAGLWRGRIRLHAAKLHVTTQAAAGFGILLPDRAWIAGQYTASTGAFADDTTDAQDADADDMGMFTTTNNDGFIVAARIPFNMISADQSTASAGGSPVFDYAYWGDPTSGRASTADAWVTVTPVVSGSFTSGADERLIVLPIPFRAMVQTTVGAVPGLPAGYYAVRVRGTTAPTATGGSAARVYVGRTLYWQTSVTANSPINLNDGSGATARLIDGGVAIGGWVGTAASSNQLYVEYS